MVLVHKYKATWYACNCDTFIIFSVLYNGSVYAHDHENLLYFLYNCFEVSIPSINTE